MSKGVRLHVWGEYALFTRPEMKVERVSYEVMTPSAARNILTAIYWKPQIRWVVDRIRIPSKYVNPVEALLGTRLQLVLAEKPNGASDVRIARAGANAAR